MDQTSQAKGDHHQGGFGLFSVGMGKAVYVFLTGLASLKFGQDKNSKRAKKRGLWVPRAPHLQAKNP